MSLCLLEEVLGDPASEYPFRRGDRVLVGYSWLPSRGQSDRNPCRIGLRCLEMAVRSRFPDLGDPSDPLSGTLDGVIWMDAYVVHLHEDQYVGMPSGNAQIYIDLAAFRCLWKLETAQGMEAKQALEAQCLCGSLICFSRGERLLRGVWHEERRPVGSGRRHH